MVGIDETAHYQGANEVDRQRGPLVALKHPTWIRSAVLVSKGRTVYQVAAVYGESDTLARFELLGSGLGVLARETPDAYDALLRAMDEHQAHLKEDFDFIGNRRRVACIEAFGAIAALEEEALAAHGVGKLGFQVQHFPGSH
jgi:hypothetical protein